MGFPAETAPFIRNTIVLKGDLGRRHEEHKANGTILPGMMLQLATDDGVLPHAAVGGAGTRRFAKEDALQGKTIYQTFGTNDIVPVHCADVGELLNVVVPANAVAILRGDKLVSNGDGTLVKAASDQTTPEILYSNVAPSAAVTTTTTETEFDKNYTLPAGALKVGDVLRVHAQGIATATNSTDTLTVKLYIGGLAGTLIVTTGAVDVANSDIFDIDAYLVVRTVGAGGTFTASGTVALGASGVVTAKAFFVGSTTIDTTATQKISVSAQWSTNNAGNSVRLDELFVERQQVGGGDFVAEAAEPLDNSAGVNMAFLSAYIL